MQFQVWGDNLDSASFFFSLRNQGNRPSVAAVHTNLLMPASLYIFRQKWSAIIVMEGNRRHQYRRRRLLTDSRNPAPRSLRNQGTASRMVRRRQR